MPKTMAQVHAEGGHLPPSGIRPKCPDCRREHPSACERIQEARARRGDEPRAVALLLDQFAQLQHAHESGSHRFGPSEACPACDPRHCDGCDSVQPGVRAFRVTFTSGRAAELERECGLTSAEALAQAQTERDAGRTAGWPAEVCFYCPGCADLAAADWNGETAAIEPATSQQEEAEHRRRFNDPGEAVGILNPEPGLLEGEDDDPFTRRVDSFDRWRGADPRPYCDGGL